MEYLQTLVPLPLDQLRLVVALFANFPLSILMHGLRNKTQNLIYSTLMGYLIQIFVLREECYFLWIQEILVYLVLRLAPRKRVGIIVLIESFAFLSGIHLRRYLSPSLQEVDVTAIMMMNTCKFIILAYCYQDGARSESIDNAEMEQKKLVQLPSFWMYLGYVQFLPSALCGPVFEYKDFADYVNRAGDFQNIPSTFMPALKQLFKTLACMGTYLGMGVFLKLQFLITEEYASRSFLYQFCYMMILVVMIKFKYYTVWLMSMIAMKASGITYEIKAKDNGEKQNSWDRVEVINITTVELDASIKNKIDAWDISVQVFLKKYIYMRILENGSKKPNYNKRKLQSKAQSLTILLSAFWHGFFPSYVISFMHYFLVLQVVQQIYRIGRETPKLQKLYHQNLGVRMVVLVLTNFIFSYFGVFFVLYTLDKIWAFSQASYGLPTLLTYVAYYLIVVKKVGSPKSLKEEGSLRASAKKTQ